MPEMRPVIFGEVLFDCFPDGTQVLGGAPFNVASHLQAFGAEPLMISCIGKDEAGEEILRAMRLRQMDTSGVQIDPNHPTGKVEIVFQDNEPHYTIVADSAWDFIAAEKLPRLPEKALLYHGSLALRHEVSREALQRLKSGNNPDVFVDINLRPPWWSADSIANVIRDSRWLKINQHELRELITGTVNDETRIQHLFHKQPIDWLFLTQGEAGASAISRQGERHHIKPAAKTAVVDTVGAGDAFSSILLLGLLWNWPMPLTLERAQQFASGIVGIRGATTDESTFYQPFIKAWNL
jgi:fructokinase